MTPPPTSPLTIAVIGLGLLGRGMAACLLGRGFRVHAVEKDETMREAAVAALDDLLAQTDTAPDTSWRERLSTAADLSGFPACHLVLESVSESASVKQQVYDELESLLPPDTVIASNTSSLSIAEFQQSRRHPARFIAMHWASPAHLTRFMEIVPGPATSSETVEQTIALARHLGKDPCLCREDVPGFLVNRIGYAMYREALNLLRSGVADADTIDRACRNALGLWAGFCGPFRWIDITGGPALYATAMANVLPSLDQSVDIPEPLAALAANGDDFHSYAPGEKEVWLQRYTEHAAAVSAMLDQAYPLSAPSFHPVTENPNP